MLLHILDYDSRHVVDGVCDEEAEAELCQAGAKSAPLDITHSKHVALTICAHHVHMVSRSFVLFWPLWCVQFKRLNRRSKSFLTKFNGAERWPRADDDAHDDGDVIGQTWWCHSSFGWRSCGDSFGAHKEQFVDFLHILTPCFDFSQFVRPMSILTNSYASFDS